MDWGHLFFTFNGRINRTQYWLAWLFFALIFAVFQFVDLLTESYAIQSVEGMITIVVLISVIAVGVKRLHDRSKSGWFLLLFYIAPSALVISAVVVGTVMEDSFTTASFLGLAGIAISIWPFVELGCLRGTLGPNQYGPDPLAPAAIPPARPA